MCQNYAEAAKWYRKEAEQGDDESQYQLGMYYADDAGMHQNDVEAYFWLSFAAAQGQAANPFPASRMLNNG